MYEMGGSDDDDDADKGGSLSCLASPPGPVLGGLYDFSFAVALE